MSIINQEYVDNHCLHITTETGYYIITSDVEGNSKALCVNRYKNQHSTTLTGSWFVSDRDAEQIETYLEKTNLEEEDIDIADILKFITL